MNTDDICAPSWKHDAASPDLRQGLDLQDVSALILEKTQVMRETLSGVLRTLGVRDLRATSDPSYAFELLSAQPADIIFSDWSPGLNGIEFLNRVRRHPETPTPFIPVIMVTANTDPRHIITARDNGITEYVAKPFTARRIYDRVWEVIERQRKFVRNATFFGPDRRRRIKPVKSSERRITVH
jgi:two-component system, chemotaxis family, chemotaxis protein CheY